MAEEQTGTQEQTGHESAPGATGPDTSTVHTPSAGTDAAGALASAQQNADVLARIAQMEQQNARHVQQIQGWEQQSQRHLEENTTLRQELEATRAQLHSVGAALTGQAPEQTGQAGTPAEAIQRYLAGDDQAVNNFFSNQEQTTRNIVDEQVMGAINVLQRQQVPFTLHPELADMANPVRNEILAAYDTMAADQSIRMIYPEDQAFMVTLPGPDGQSRLYDPRILDRAGLQVKAGVAREEGAQAEQTRQQTGDTMSSTGASGATGGEIDPVELFSAKELEQFMDQAVLRALPASVSRDVKSVAAYLVEGMTDAERTNRMDQQQARRRGMRV